MIEPRILVGITTYKDKDYMFHNCYNAVMKMDYPKSKFDVIVVDNTADNSYYLKLKRKGYKGLYRVERGANSREALTKSQNRIRQLFLEGDYDYLLFVESDLLIPPDTLKRLLSYNKPVVGSTYDISRNKEQFIPCIFITNNSGGFTSTRPLGVIVENGVNVAYDAQEINSFFKQPTPIVQVHGCGLGCTLVKREVVSRFPFWCDIRFDNKHSDVYFYLDLENNGVPVFVDITTVIPHYPSDWTKVSDR